MGVFQSKKSYQVEKEEKKKSIVEPKKRSSDASRKQKQNASEAEMRHSVGTFNNLNNAKIDNEPESESATEYKNSKSAEEEKTIKEDPSLQTKEETNKAIVVEEQNIEDGNVKESKPSKQTVLESETPEKVEEQASTETKTKSVEEELKTTNTTETFIKCKHVEKTLSPDNQTKHIEDNAESETKKDDPKEETVENKHETTQKEEVEDVELKDVQPTPALTEFTTEAILVKNNLEEKRNTGVIDEHENSAKENHSTSNIDIHENSAELLNPNNTKSEKSTTAYACESIAEKNNNQDRETEVVSYGSEIITNETKENETVTPVSTTKRLSESEDLNKIEVCNREEAQVVEIKLTDDDKTEAEAVLLTEVNKGDSNCNIEVYTYKDENEKRVVQIETTTVSIEDKSTSNRTDNEAVIDSKQKEEEVEDRLKQTDNAQDVHLELKEDKKSSSGRTEKEDQSKLDEKEKQVDVLSEIAKIEDEIRSLREQVTVFTGTNIDKQYLTLKESLVRCIIKLDDIDVLDSDDEKRGERKRVIKLAQESLDALERNVVQKKAGSDDDSDSENELTSKH